MKDVVLVHPAVDLSTVYQKSRTLLEAGVADSVSFVRRSKTEHSARHVSAKNLRRVEPADNIPPDRPAELPKNVHVVRDSP